MGLPVPLAFCEPGTSNPSFYVHRQPSGEVISFAKWNHCLALWNPFSLSVFLFLGLQLTSALLSFLRSEQGQAGPEIVICSTRGDQTEPVMTTSGISSLQTFAGGVSMDVGRCVYTVSLNKHE